MGKASGKSKPSFPPSEKVIAYVREVFRQANARVATMMCRMPTTHEPQLDMSLVNAIAEHAGPVALEDGWVVRIETHYLGGKRHWQLWEVADIGLLIMLRSRTELVQTKTAVLQSKRLYPKDAEHEEDSSEDYMIGFGRLLRDGAGPSPWLTPRTMTVAEDSAYEAFDIPSDQFAAIRAYSAHRKTPVFYLFHNPSVLPWSIELPASPNSKVPETVEVGLRVAPFAKLDVAFGKKKKRFCPTYKDIVSVLQPEFTGDDTGGWRLETFVADRVLRCHEGFLAEKQTDDELMALFFRRAGPIAAAFAITIDAPPGAGD